MAPVIPVKSSAHTKPAMWAGLAVWRDVICRNIKCLCQACEILWQAEKQHIGDIDMTSVHGGGRIRSERLASSRVNCARRVKAAPPGSRDYAGRGAERPARRVRSAGIDGTER